MENSVETAVSILGKMKTCVALTGAGISVESGVPDYRSSKGIWERFPPEEYASLEAFKSNPSKVWGCWRELALSFCGKEPNKGHRVLAELEALGYIEAVITQNIDGLHQQAGSRNVIEFDGNTRSASCLECGRTSPLEVDNLPDAPLRCQRCDGLMRPDVLFFGETIDKEVWRNTLKYLRTCDVMIIIGTSGKVSPAADLPMLAKDQGAVILEFNVYPTVFTDSITDKFIQGSASKTLTLLETLIRKKELPLAGN
ncbi:MAG: NAD-dependent deacylase [Planctomycetes bacterium]|nr:NAD-dependent deacylase [Planctomycetota bacterium]